LHMVSPREQSRATKRIGVLLPLQIDMKESHTDAKR
jgi:hypothetical protein